jgi:hypothetical protein
MSLCVIRIISMLVIARPSYIDAIAQVALLALRDSVEGSLYPCTPPRTAQKASKHPRHDPAKPVFNLFVLPANKFVCQAHRRGLKKMVRKFSISASKQLTFWHRHNWFQNPCTVIENFFATVTPLLLLLGWTLPKVAGVGRKFPFFRFTANSTVHDTRILTGSKKIVFSENQFATHVCRICVMSHF